jgi:hypothetical protein
MKDAQFELLESTVDSDIPQSDGMHSTSSLDEHGNTIFPVNTIPNVLPIHLRVR